MFLMYGRIHNKLYLIFKSIGEKFDCRQWPRRRWLAKYSQAQFHLSSAYQIKKFELEWELRNKLLEQLDWQLDDKLRKEEV